MVHRKWQPSPIVVAAEKLSTADCSRLCGSVMPGP